VTRYRIDPDRSVVWIDARSSVHPIRSRTDGLTGWIEIGLTKTGRVSSTTSPAAHLELPVDRLRSGNPLEDRELRRRIDARRHPTIEGDLTSITAAGEPGRYRVSGAVTFRGVTQPHDGEMEIAALDDGALRWTGASTFDVRDHGMEPPRILVLRVEPLVEVRIEVIAQPEG
jgi:polyisoprenoid-binding protein YceI